MKTLTTYLWIKKSAISKKTGLAPILCRISYSKSDEVDIQTNIKVSPENWNNEFKQVFGITSAAEMNRQLGRVLEKVIKIDTERTTLDQERSAQILKNIIEEKGEHKQWTIIDLINEHNEKYQIGITNKIKGHSEATLNKYYRLKDVIIEFLKLKYNRADIFASELNYDFIESFVFFLSTNKKLSNESIRSSYFGKLNKIITNAVKKNRIKKFPFEDFSMEREEQIDDSNWLTMEEILMIHEYRFTKSQRLERIRERVVLSMFTGLAYIDLETLNISDLHVDMTGFKYISKSRQKTLGESIIPIIPEIEQILEKYSTTATERQGKLLPKLSNKNYREYLREMLDIIGINKEVTPHKLRHSFAQANLEAGVSLEAVSKMLGHKDTRTVTKHYAKLNKNVVFQNSDKLQNSINRIKGIIPKEQEDDDNIRSLGAG